MPLDVDDDLTAAHHRLEALGAERRVLEHRTRDLTDAIHAEVVEGAGGVPRLRVHPAGAVHPEGVDGELHRMRMQPIRGHRVDLQIGDEIPRLRLAHVVDAFLQILFHEKLLKCLRFL